MKTQETNPFRELIIDNFACLEAAERFEIESREKSTEEKIKELIK